MTEYLKNHLLRSLGLLSVLFVMGGAPGLAMADHHESGECSSESCDCAHGEEEACEHHSECSCDESASAEGCDCDHKEEE